MYKDVDKLHKKFGLLRFKNPGHLSKRKMDERIAFLQEELREFMVAADNDDIAGQADALVDLVYVALGTARMMGLPWKDLWDDVQRANMAKVRGMGPRGHKVDLIKPEGWVQPRTLRILTDAGYDVDFPHKERDDAEHLPDNI